MSQKKVFQGDTALVEAWCFEEDGETPATCSAVTWSYLVPGDVTATSVSTDAPTTGVSLAEGSTLTDMTGTFEYVMTAFDGLTETLPTAVQSITVANKRIVVSYLTADLGVTVRNIYRRKSPGEVYYLITTVGAASGSYTDTQLEDDETAQTPSFATGDNYARLAIEDTTELGLYRVAAQFTRADGSRKSIPASFEVLDPLELASTTDLGQVIDLAWMFLEDCFDSEMGGPWLRDVTLASFDKYKMASFTGSAIFMINQRPPVNTYDEDSFPYSTASPLLAKGMLIEAIKHLMRSYVEQPAVAGSGQISYFDRRDYLQRWQTILQVEQEDFKTWLALFKREQYAFGQSKVLVDIKAGRRIMIWPGLRLRYPRYRFY